MSGMGLSLNLSGTTGFASPLATVGSMANGGKCSGWFPNSAIVQAGGVFSQWTDVSGNGNHLGVGTGTPVYSASSASIAPAGPSVNLTGASSLKRAAYKGGTAAGQPRFIRVVAKIAAAGGYLADFEGYVGLFVGSAANAGKPALQDAQFTQMFWTVSAIGSVVSIWGFSEWASGTINRKLSVSNAAPVTGSTTTTNVSSATNVFEVGASGGAVNCNAEFFDIFTANQMLTNAELAADDAFVLATYGHH